MKLEHADSKICLESKPWKILKYHCLDANAGCVILFKSTISIVPWITFETDEKFSSSIFDIQATSER